MGATAQSWPFTDVETIATGRGIRELRRLQKRHGFGRWRKRKGIARVGKRSRSSDIWIDCMPSPRRQLLLCLRNDGYEVPLERRKIYAALPGRDASRHRQIRVIDESGEDYLYPAKLFAAVELPQAVRRVMLAAG